MANILIVDDQLGVRRLLYETFREDQHQVKMAANGLEALNILSEFNPQLILMDMKMPGMNGIETISKIRENDKDVAVILMTAYGDAQNLEQAQELNVEHYLSKPFDIFELREKITEVLSKIKESAI